MPHVTPQDPLLTGALPSHAVIRGKVMFGLILVAWAILYAPAAWPHHLFTVTAITSVMICINWHWLAKQARIFQPLAEAPEHVRRDDSTW